MRDVIELPAIGQPASRRARHLQGVPGRFQPVSAGLSLLPGGVLYMSAQIETFDGPMVLEVPPDHGADFVVRSATST